MAVFSYLYFNSYVAREVTVTVGGVLQARGAFQFTLPLPWCAKRSVAGRVWERSFRQRPFEYFAAIAVVPGDAMFATLQSTVSDRIRCQEQNVVGSQLGGQAVSAAASHFHRACASVARAV